MTHAVRLPGHGRVDAALDIVQGRRRVGGVPKGVIVTVVAGMADVAIMAAVAIGRMLRSGPERCGGGARDGRRRVLMRRPADAHERSRQTLRRHGEGHDQGQE